MRAWFREMLDLFRTAWQIEKEWWKVKRALKARMKELGRG